MQQRESAFLPRDPLEALLARSDEAALDYVTDRLLDGGDVEAPPLPDGTVTEAAFHEAG
jgi:hypothetical protein